MYIKPHPDVLQATALGHNSPSLHWDYYLCGVLTGASIISGVTACQLLLASSSLSGPIRHPLILVIQLLQKV
jgi:hypothetical protein